MTATVPGDPAHGVSVAGRRCRNCGATAEARFCPACGQATALHPPTVGEFVHEFLGHHVALEGPLWRTLGALLLTPGRLTVDYFAGRRQRYIPPLRLYLTFSLILFAVTGLQGEGLRIGNETVEFRLPKESDTATVVAPRVDAGTARGDGFLDRTKTHIASMTPRQRNERINAGVRQYLPYVLIVLVPVLALLFRLAYWKRRMYYGEHLVVAFHAQTVAFIFAIVSAIPMGETIGALWVIVLVAHGAIALRRVYGGRWVPTVLRELLLLLTYSVVVGLALALLATLTLAI